MIVRDFYFGAWLIKEHGYQYLVADGKVNIEIDKSNYNKLLQIYKENHKEYYDFIRQLIKEANQSRITGAAY